VGGVCLEVDLGGEVGVLLGGQGGCKGGVELLVGGMKASETFVALSYSYSYQVLLCVGDDALGVVAPDVGKEMQGGGVRPYFLHS
jgi:hypothetical protein